MPPTLAAYLKKRSTKHFRALELLLPAINAETALAYVHSNWPDHRWGVGQNGSICGIVYHLAAWKALTLPVFQTGGEPLPREAMNRVVAPAADDWQAVRAWYSSIGEEWDAAVQNVPEEVMDEVRLWEGHPTPLYSFISELMEHDLQHASQIDYLLQKAAAEGVA
jgi:hypothetical protein